MLVHSFTRKTQWLDEPGVALNIFVYMIQVGKKTNERAVIEQNIRDIIHGRNWMISIDAIGTGSNIIDIICEEGCDAVFPVKDNQKTLSSLILNYIVRKIIEEATPFEHYVDLDDFSENDTPSRVINNTKCKVVLDDNPGNGPYISEDEETSTETASDEAADSLDSSNSENFKQEPVHVSEETVPHSVNTDKTGSCNLGETVQPSASETPKAALNHQLEEESAQHENPIDSASKDSTSSACNSTENTVPLDDFIFFDPLYDYTSKFSPDIPLNSDNTKLVYVAVGNRLIPMVSSHGRYERREYEYIALPEELRNEVPGDMAEDWHNVKAIGLVTRYRAKLARDRATKSKYYAVTISRTPYILTRESTAEEFAGMVRSHWGIESFQNVLTPLWTKIIVPSGSSKDQKTYLY